MSVHSSLVVKAALKRHRNVLKREERLEQMIRKEKWQEGDSVFGIPKTRVPSKMKKKAKKKKEE